MSHRDTASETSSNVGLPSLYLTPNYKHNLHPEEWTLPKEWKIDLREPYRNWKYDVHCQIANMQSRLDQSLRQHPWQAGSQVSRYQTYPTSNGGGMRQEMEEKLLQEQFRNAQRTRKHAELQQNKYYGGHPFSLTARKN